MNTPTRILAMITACAVLWAAAPEAVAQAQMGRVSLKVVDPDGRPLPDVTVTVTSPALDTFELVKTTNKKGKALLAISDTTLPYTIRLEKNGWAPREEPLQVLAGGTFAVELMLAPVQVAAPAVPDEEVGEQRGGPRSVRTYNEGVEAQRLGDLELAAARYLEAAGLDPELAAARTSLAAVALIQDDYAAAAEHAEAALAIDPDDVRAMQLRFDAYRLGGDADRAAASAEALRAIGDLADAAARIFNEGVDAFTDGRIGEAISKFKQVTELDPEHVAAYLALAQVSLAEGAPTEALAMADQALELEPDNVRANKLAFDAARLAGDTGTAAGALDRLVELDPEWIRTTLYEHAAELFNANRPEAAAFELAYVVRAHPELAKARFMYGVALFNNGRVDEGREQLRVFVELAPDDPDAGIARGLVDYGGS